MRRFFVIVLVTAFATGLLIVRGNTHPEHTSATAATSLPTRSSPGENPWNRGREPEDWRAEIERYHGHIGPWNVLGWRIGRAAMNEMNARWGDHSLQIICHIPTAMPYSCLVEGLMVGTGNSQGRLDLRVAEELTSGTVHVSIRKTGTSQIIEYWPHPDYLRKIESHPASELGLLVDECTRMRDTELFTVIRR